MNIFENHNIKNSLQIKASCRFYVEITNENDFNDFYVFIRNKQLPVFILGDGTNIIPPEYYDGIIVKPLFNNINYLNETNIVSVGASINWHYLVKEMVSKNIYGFENLSLIPGTVGAAPIQNIGAYGQEVCNLINKVDCFNYETGKFLSLTKEECNFSYRDSSLKKGNLIIFSIDFKTDSINRLNLDYKSIQTYLDANKINLNSLNLNSVSDIICKIRNSILPDPSEVPNAGSFFKNPIIDKNKINTEHFSLDKLIIWDIDSKYVKVGAARLIELIKKDLIEDKNINIYDKHALVLTTNSKISQDSILDYANQIKSKVLEVFNISLEIEPTIISN